MRRTGLDDKIYLRGKIYWARVRDRSGQVVRKSTKCRTIPAALQEYERLEREAVDQTYGAAAETTLAKAIADYYADLQRRRVSEATRSIAEQKCGHLVRVWGQNMPLSLVTSKLVHDYIDRRQREDVTDHTIKKELGQLRQVLVIARHHGLFPLEVEQVMPPYFSAKHKPRETWLTPAELRRLLAELTQDRAAHVAWMVATGGRLAESYRAERKDVDWTRGTILMRGSKTAGSWCELPVSPLMRGLLERALRGAPGNRPLFRPWDKLHRDMAAACRRADVPRVTPNDLRRTFGTWHREAGVNINLISKLLRHTTDKLAQTTYARLGADALGKLLGDVPDLYESAAPAALPAHQPLTDESPQPEETANLSGAPETNRTSDQRFRKLIGLARSDSQNAEAPGVTPATNVPKLYRDPVLAQGVGFLMGRMP